MLSGIKSQRVMIVESWLENKMLADLIGMILSGMLISGVGSAVDARFEEMVCKVRGG